MTTTTLPVQPEDCARPFDACWQLYALAKAEYLALHPGATAEEIEAFCKRKAQELGL